MPCCQDLEHHCPICGHHIATRGIGVVETPFKLEEAKSQDEEALKAVGHVGTGLSVVQLILACV